ncbi:MAG: HpcH/HpaI aldolase family protein [Sphaerochaetaceae bacterium]
MNNLRKRLEENQLAIGTHISFDDPAISEMMGYAGYDFLWIDEEHTPLGKQSIQNHIIAAKAAGTASIVRIPWNDQILAKSVLEMGPDGIIFPMVNTAEEAKEAIASCCYPPEGIRGFGPRRAVKYGFDDSIDYVKKNGDFLKILQIETAKAVANLNDIIKVKGIDAFIIGPCDLSLSLSLNVFGDNVDGSFLKTIATAIQKAKDAHIPIGVSMGSYSSEDMKFWIEQGVDFLSVGGDVSYLKQGAVDAIQNFKELR